MKTVKIPLTSATPDQLRTFANTIGLEISPADADSAVLAKLQAAWSQEHITVAAPAEDVDMTGDAPVPPPGFVAAAVDATAGGGDRMQGGSGRSDPKVNLTISQPENLEGKPTNTDVSIGVNGFAWQLRRGTPIDVPYRVFLALKAAVAMQVTMVDGEEVHTERPRFGYTVHRMPSSEEIARWEAAEAECDQFCPA